MSSAELQLPSNLQNALEWLVKELGAWIGRDQYEMGGGTVLAARWRHRLSTDIDLFVEAAKLGGKEIDQIIEGFRELEVRKEVSALETRPQQGFSCRRENTPVSFFVTHAVMPARVSAEIIQGVGIGTESSAEILLKKVRARMIRNPRYLPRDMYDLIVAHVEDRQAVEDVFGILTAEECKILGFDARRDAFQVTNVERIIAPSYPQLIDPFENLVRFARIVLAQELKAPELRELEGMRRKVTSN